MSSPRQHWKSHTLRCLAFFPLCSISDADVKASRCTSHRCYSPLVYYLSKFIEEAFLCIFTSSLFSCIVFFGVQLQGSFWTFFAVYYLTTMNGITLAYAVAAVAPNMDAANALLPTLVTMWMYFGGAASFAGFRGRALCSFVPHFLNVQKGQQGHAFHAALHACAHWYAHRSFAVASLLRRPLSALR